MKKKPVKRSVKRKRSIKRGETLSDLLGAEMATTTYYKCNVCKSKVLHVFRSSHMQQHPETLHTFFTALKNEMK